MKVKIKYHCPKCDSVLRGKGDPYCGYCLEVIDWDEKDKISTKTGDNIEFNFRAYNQKGTATGRIDLSEQCIDCKNIKVKNDTKGIEDVVVKCKIGKERETDKTKCFESKVWKANNQ